MSQMFKSPGKYKRQQVCSIFKFLTICEGLIDEVRYKNKSFHARLEVTECDQTESGKTRHYAIQECEKHFLEYDKSEWGKTESDKTTAQLRYFLGLVFIERLM
jgi:hypothetical protein